MQFRTAACHRVPTASCTHKLDFRRKTSTHFAIGPMRLTV